MVVTDDAHAYPSAMMVAGIHGSRHETINHSAKIYVQGEIYTHTVESAFSLVKRGLNGVVS